MSENYIETFSKPYSIIEYEYGGSGSPIISNMHHKILSSHKPQNKFIDDDYDGPIKYIRRLTDTLLSGIIE